MHNPDNEFSAGDQPEWNEFEERLRAQSLGNGPPPRDRVLYECGYAAAIAAAAKQRRSQDVRWRALALAASLVACASLATHLVPNQRDQDLANRKPPEVRSAPETRSSSDTWMAALVQGRSSERPSIQTTRLPAMPSDWELAPINGAVVPANRPAEEKPLRPRDSQRFLNGEV